MQSEPEVDEETLNEADAFEEIQFINSLFDDQRENAGVDND